MEHKTPKWQRISAIILVCLLLSLYLVSLVCSFINHPLANSMLWASLFATIVVPVFLYVFRLCVNHFRPKDREEHS